MAVTDTPLEIEIVDPLPRPGADGPGAGSCSRAETDVRSIDPVVDAIGEGLERVGDAIERAARVVSLRLEQIDVDGNPRKQSRVRHHVFAPYHEVVERLPECGERVAHRGTRLEITSPFRAKTGGGAKAEAKLRLRGSWPALPLVISVDPWWRERTLFTVRLRTHRRWRYPRRYYRGVHHALRKMTADG